MAWLKGPKSDGVIQINHPVKFNKAVQSSSFEPWANVWYVDGDNGNDSHDGRGPSEAKASVQAAVNAASMGDIIYVRPKAPGGSTDGDVSDVGFYTNTGITIPFAKSQLSIIGVVNSGNSMYGPFLWPSTGAAIDVYAAAFHAENLTAHAEDVTYSAYLRGVSGYTTAGGACGSTIYNCTLGYGTILVTGGGDVVLDSCRFRNNFVHFDASLTPARRHMVRNCWFGANNGAALATAYFVIQGTQSEFLMTGCHFDQPTTADEYINSSGVVDGLISNCYFADDDITWGTSAAAQIRIASGTLTVSGCYDNSGSIIGPT